LLDTHQQGRLIGSEGGFGLLTNKTLHWFAPNGTKLGSLHARDPIRAIYATQEGATIQTRQHEVEVRGLAIMPPRRYEMAGSCEPVLVHATRLTTRVHIASTRGWKTASNSAHL